MATSYTSSSEKNRSLRPARDGVLRRIFKAFEYPDFRLMWLGACTSSIGTWMQNLAQAWLVYSLSGSSFYLGLDAFLGQAPIIMLSLLGGVVADRKSRRSLLLMSQVIQMTSAFCLAALFYFGVVKVWHILALSFVTGTAQAFGGPAYMALIPTLVDSEDLPNAIALNSIQFNLARVIGPMLGGIALTQLGAAWCFGLNGVSFIAVIISLLLIQPQFVPARTAETILQSMQQGIGFIRARTGMVALIVLAFCMTLLGIPVNVFLPVVAKEVFHQGPSIFTVFLCFSGAGSVCGALLVAALSRRKHLGRPALLTLILLGALIASFSLSRSLVLSCVLIFLCGASLIAVFALISSLVQLITSDNMRGRVMSVYNVAFRGGMPIGSLAMGTLIPVFTAPVALAATGVALSVLGLYFLLVQRQVAAL